MSEERAKEKFNQAMDLFIEKRYQDAIDAFKQVIYIQPHFFEALYNLACCMAVTNQRDQALMYLGRACNINPDCALWAKEDTEFESFHGNEMFNSIINTTNEKMNTESKEPQVSGLTAIVSTSKGEINLKLFPEEAPLTVANFVNLANRGYYDGLKFHRVIEDFMIQGGCPFGTGTGGPGYQFKDEFNPSLRHNKSGILSMANAGPGTNGSQFFITHKDTPWLDDKHTVFGEVVSEKDQEVVDAIAQNDEITSVKIQGDASAVLQQNKDQLNEWNKILDKKFSHLK